MNIIDLLTDYERKEYISYKTYLSNQVVFNENDICEKIGIVLDGEILIKTYTHTIKEEIITIINANQLFGQYLLFSDYNNYLGIGVASKKTKVAFISKVNLIYLLQNNTSFLKYYLNIICTNTVNIKQQAKLFAHKNIRDRIIYYLEHNQIEKKVTIPSVTFLANLLSIPRPSISRELSKMENDKLIKRINKDIYIMF